MFDNKSELMAIAREFLVNVTTEMDSYTTRKGIISEQDNSMILLTPSHVQFAKYGRAPGKKPPLDPILDWVKSKGIKFGSSSDEGTAFAIQRMIGEKGTKNFTPNAPNFLEEVLSKNYDEYIRKTSSAIKVQTTKIVKDSLGELFPKKIEFKI